MIKSFSNRPFSAELTLLAEMSLCLLMNFPPVTSEAYLVGIAANIKVKAIRVLNNGRRAISLVKYGLNFIADTLLNPFRPTKINVYELLSCT